MNDRVWMGLYVVVVLALAFAAMDSSLMMGR